ncbi:NAD(+) diphosphatase [Microlunatus soli]|uniref:NAD(+) diphosphatase n=1 Tax=Microlunatus soli TaxID=630515 RepID=A0A1H1U2X3_9ACTN|nr:NAD(+) diphosphatase [Microlunatus soli]SDS66808.1 NAD+ diphosphatase [Microlunatus soli]
MTVSHPEFAFWSEQIDRAAEVRSDPARLDALWKSPTSRVAVVDGSSVGAVDGAPRWLASDEAPEGERIFLGLTGEDPEQTAWWAVIVEQSAEELQPTPVRDLLPTLTALDGSLLAQAVGIANWHRTHPRCARCGAPTEIVAAGHVRQCPECSAQHFPRTDPAVIMLITDDQDRALLGRGAGWPEGRFSTLAGFVEPGEALEDAVRREVMEETSVAVDTVRYAASQPWPFPSSLMVGFYGTARDQEITIDPVEIAEAHWFTREEARQVLFPRLNGPVSGWSISSWLMSGWLESIRP